MWNFGSRIVLLLWRYVKYGLISKHLFQRTQHGGWKNPRLTVNFYKKQCLPVMTWAIKYSSKQVISISYTLEKKFFAAATFEGL